MRSCFVICDLTMNETMTDIGTLRKTMLKTYELYHEQLVALRLDSLAISSFARHHSPLRYRVTGIAHSNEHEMLALQAETPIQPHPLQSQRLGVIQGESVHGWYISLLLL